jgi:anti-sigma regulatory factor (Ser/Thr protein kinase)
MPAITRRERDLVVRETTTETTIRMAPGPTTPALAREHVRSGLSADMSAGRMCDLVLLTNELVTNAVEYSDAGSLDLTIVRGRTFTRIEVRNPNESWARAPEPHSPEPDQIGGWGLFLVEHLSDRWGTSDADCMVWFEFDHPASVVTRLDALESECYEDAEAPGEPHSCIEEKALFLESLNAVIEAFERFDESTARQAVSDDLRSGEDRRQVSMTVCAADERRRPSRPRGGRQDDVR